MRLKFHLALLLVMLAVSSAAQEVQPARGTVRGVLMAFGRGEPLAGATIHLAQSSQFNANPNPDLSVPRQVRGGPVASMEARSDAAGNFVFADVPPGQWILAPDAGYQFAGHQRDFARPSFTLDPGEDLRHVVLPLVKLSTVSGRVFSRDVPQASVSVDLYELVYGGTGERYLGSYRGNAITDAEGRYRIPNVSPGEYYLAVARTRQAGASFGTWFYPDVTNAEAAVPIRVPWGTDAAGFDVRLSDKPASTITVRLDRPASVPREFLAYFQISTKSRGHFRTALATPRFLESDFRLLKDDVYVSPPLPPDFYVVEVTWVPPTGGSTGNAIQSLGWRYPRARFNAEVIDKPVDVGRIAAWKAPSQISGRVFLDEPDAAFVFEGVAVGLATTLPVGGYVGVPMLKGGAVALELPAGEYVIRPQPPSGYYVKSARFGGREVLDRPFMIEADAAASLEIVLAKGAATVEGILRNATYDPVPFGRVVLIPEHYRRGNALLYPTAATDKNGAFSIRGIAPGEYTVLAWDWVRLYAYLNADFLRQVETLGRKITVGPGSKNVLNPVAISGMR